MTEAHGMGKTSIMIGPSNSMTAALGRALGIDDVQGLPDFDGGGSASPSVDPWSWSWAPRIQRWSDEFRTSDQRKQVVVCCWNEVPAIRFVDLGPAEWMERLEWHMAVSFAALRSAGDVCGDGGSIVIVVERPYALDAEGYSTTVAAAEGILSLGRSMAASLGSRSIRVNGITTELTTAPDVPAGPPVFLPTFPGRIETEVAGAVRFLLSDESAGLTGSVLTADCGRTP